MTVLEVIQRSTEFLARKGVESPRLQVELLLAGVLKVPRLRLYLDFERILSDSELEKIREWVKRRGTREPLQHILGNTSFCGLDFEVSRDVLIPRPETEVLAERAWQFLEQRLAGGITEVSVLDFGTGSGCLAVTLAKRVPAARVYAMDISPAALAVARKNAEAHGVVDRLSFVEGNGFLTLPAGQRFDLIISNPPYISSAEIEQLAPEVRDHDPRVALDGGVDGLEIFRHIAAEARKVLLKDGKLMCEFGDGQATDLRLLFERNGWMIEATLPDLSGRSRILVANQTES